MKSLCGWVSRDLGDTLYQERPPTVKRYFIVRLSAVKAMG